MITKEEYDNSVSRLQEKERLNKLYAENGKNFLIQYQDTLQLSKNNKQHIFLLFYMPGCDGCNIIKYLIDNDNQVQNYLKKYMVLMCDVSNTKTNLVQKYNLYSYPAYFIIDSNEKIIKQKIGCSVLGGPERNFINWLISKP